MSSYCTPSVDIFNSITDDEIRITTSLIKKSCPNDNVQFIQVDRVDPPKKLATQLLNYVRYGKGTKPRIPRRTYAYFYKNNEMPLYKSLVNTTERHITCTCAVDAIGPLSPEFVNDCDEKVFDIPEVQAEIAKLKLDTQFYDHPQLGKLKYKILSEAWMYGISKEEDAEKPLCQVFMYLKLDHPNANHYSIPLTFSPVLEYLTAKYIRMDYLPNDALESFNPIVKPFIGKDIDHVPFEYHPDVVPNYKPAKGLKPLIVEQPEGPSFNVDSNNKITWQGWEFYVQSNVREGFAIYDVHFQGRSLFYRFALNEMCVPYSSKNETFSRKMAFDLGDCGFGNAANSLKLGCHCLGVIKYLDFRRSDREGNPVVNPSTICMHEQDYGILFLHQNYRSGASTTTRRREFVVQTIATVANYEYIVNFVFDQGGAINVQVRATGILSTTPLNTEVTSTDFGTIIAPGVHAPFHQHLLSFKFDPRLDGDNNSVCYDDYVPNEEDPEKWNVGYVQKRTFMEKSGHIDQSPFTNRTYKVINEHSINPTTKKPVAYKFEMPAKQMIMAGKNSYHLKRAHFATQQFWVHKYDDERRYAAGEFTNQSRKDTGISKWCDGTESVRDEELTVQVTLALTHPPSSEQFPLMSSDFMQFAVSPSSFYSKNPALNVPLATNKFNQSVYYEDSAKTCSNAAGSCCSKI
ncbi:hypothetical protein ACO0RG_000107 [Hanseniaspora osmophila]